MGWVKALSPTWIGIWLGFFGILVTIIIHAIQVKGAQSARDHRILIANNSLIAMVIRRFAVDQQIISHKMFNDISNATAHEAGVDISLLISYSLVLQRCQKEVLNNPFLPSDARESVLNLIIDASKIDPVIEVSEIKLTAERPKYAVEWLSAGVGGLGSTLIAALIFSSVKNNEWFSLFGGIMVLVAIVIALYQYIRLINKSDSLELPDKIYGAENSDEGSAALK